MRTDDAQTIEAPRTAPDKPTDRHVAEFEKFAATAAADNPQWMLNLRKAAISQFAELGLPTIKHEEWKYTNVAPIAKLPFKPVTSATARINPADLGRFSFGDAHRLVFINGVFAPDLSSFDDEVQVASLREAVLNNQPELEKHLARYAPYDQNPFTALNTAFFHDGAVILIAPRQQLGKPVHLLFLTAGLVPGDTVHPRNLIIAGAESQATILETYASLGDVACVTNAVTEVIVNEAAHIEHLKFQNESPHAFHLATVQAHQLRDSLFTSHSVSVGARLARNDIRVKLDDAGGEGVLNGLYIGTGEQVVDHHTVVDHAKPNCNTHEFYHGILDGRSQGVFNGKIFVRKDAQKTNAKQSNRNLLLTREAAVNTKPQLEIFADDVKCTHGATIGQLDENALFYLRCRGIPHEKARRMLIYAFAADVVNRISVKSVRKELEKLLHERFD